MPHSQCLLWVLYFIDPEHELALLDSVLETAELSGKPSTLLQQQPHSSYADLRDGFKLCRLYAHWQLS